MNFRDELTEKQANFTVLVKGNGKSLGEQPFDTEEKAQAFIKKNFDKISKPDKFDTMSAVAKKDGSDVELTIIKDTPLKGK